MNNTAKLNPASAAHRAAGLRVAGLEQAARIAAAPGFDPEARDLILDELEAARLDAARLAGEYAEELAARATRPARVTRGRLA